MDLPREKTNPNINPLIEYISMQRDLSSGQEKRYVQQLTQECKIEHNRTECHGATLTKLLPTINPNNEPYLTHRKRISKWARCQYERQNAGNGYVIQILNTRKIQPINNKSISYKLQRYSNVANAINAMKDQTAQTPQQYTC